MGIPPDWTRTLSQAARHGGNRRDPGRARGYFPEDGKVLAETRTASLLAIGLQQLGLILLAAAGAVSILVYRLAREMSGGRLAASMLCIVI